MSNEELSVIHSKSCTILEELYDARGQPAELNDAFIKEYFNLIRTGLGLGNVEVLGPHATDARLSGPDSGLVDVRISSKSEKFLVSNLAAVNTMTGTSQRMGSDRGKGTYLMTDVKGIPNITIKTGSAIVVYVGLPKKVKTESGQGEWVKM
ncbi:hypothetical protein BS17DRAFT_579100 [Gyrodon lividus]|nr:hypothetical protein BS17DRAFT_579100 [Gyrodon lividus]